MDRNKSFWDRFAPVYDLFMGKDKRAYRDAISLISGELDKTMKVLEIAAGTGIFAAGLSGFCGEYIATDFSGNMIRRAARKHKGPNLTFAVQDAMDLSFADGTFDAVVIANALHIMPEPEKVLDEISRVLKDGGKLFAPTFVRSGKLTERIMEKPMKILGFRTYSRWTLESFTAFLAGHGWVITQKKIIKASFPLAYAAAVKG